VRPLAALLAVLAVPPAAGAAVTQIALPDPHMLLTQSPPLQGSAPAELRVIRTGATREAIRIRVDATGRPVTVSADQRITLVAPGDYSFVVPGPVLDVTAPPGSRVQPGLLQGAIVWQGFSPGKRTLAATAKLDPAATAPVLPLALRLIRGRDSVTLEVKNRTPVTVDAYTGRGDAAELEHALTRVRADVLAGRNPGRPLVHATISPARVRVDAPFRVRGELRLGGRVARFAQTLGGGHPSTLRIHLTGQGTPRLTVRAEPLVDVAVRRTLGGAVESMLRLARTNQYRTFLQTPGLAEQTHTTYTWTSTSAVPAAPAAPAEHGGNDAARTALVLAATVVGLAVAITLWTYL
jgi:hypothetical protein